MSVSRRQVSLRAELLEDRSTPTALPGVAPLVTSGPLDGTALVYQAQVGGKYTTPVATLRPFGAIAADVRTATADVDGDLTPDVVLVTGPGVPLRLAVISGKDYATVLVAPFDPLGGNSTAGGNVAAGDFDRDGRAEVAVTPDDSGGPRVAIFSLTTNGFRRRNDFLTLDPDFRGGLRIAAGDVNGDGTPELVVTAGVGGGPRVTVLNGPAVLTTNGTDRADKLLNDFFVFDLALRNGAYVAVGDVNGDRFGDLIFGAGPGGGPEVKIVSGQALISRGVPAAIDAPFADFFVANTDSDRGGVRVAAVNADGDFQTDVAVGTGIQQPSRVRIYPGRNFLSTAEPTGFQDLNPYNSAVLPDGTFVG